MPRWQSIISVSGQRLGTVEAPDEKSAVDAAAMQFSITSVRRNKIAVLRIDERKRAE